MQPCDWLELYRYVFHLCARMLSSYHETSVKYLHSNIKLSDEDQYGQSAGTLP